MNPVIVTVSRNGCLFDSMAGQLTARGASLIRSDPGASAIVPIDRHMPDLVIHGQRQLCRAAGQAG